MDAIRRVFELNRKFSLGPESYDYDSMSREFTPLLSTNITMSIRSVGFYKGFTASIEYLALGLPNGMACCHQVAFHVHHSLPHCLRAQ